MTCTPIKTQLHSWLHLESKRLLISVLNFYINIEFNTTFFIAKKELPFTKYKGQLDLQRNNGVKLN